MKIIHILTTTIILLALTGCGPFYGMATKGGEGLQSFKVIEGDLSALKPGGKLLVYGPFAITDDAYYIAKGEDASQFTDQFQKTGFQESELYLERSFKKLTQTAQQLRSKSAAQLKSLYNLDISPDTILFGTILKRGPVKVVPYRAVMPVTYRLEFYNIASKTSAMVVVEAEMRYEEIISAIVEQIMRQSGGQN